MLRQRLTFGPILLVALALLGLLAVPGPAPGQTVTLKFGDIYAESHSNSKGAFKFAELVSQKSKGQVKIDVFVDAKLGNEREQAEGVVAGSLDIVASGLSGIGRFIQPIHTLELPYIYRDLEHMNRVAGALAPDVDTILRKSGLRNLGFFFLGPRSIAGKRPIRALEDMRGLRFRVPEAPLYVGMARALGATPTPVAFPEAYTSLQTGVVEAAEGEPGTLWSTKWYEPAKFISLTEHIYHFRYLAINEKAFQRLSPAQQQALQEAGKETTAYQLGLVGEFNKDSLEKMRSAGATIVPVADKRPFEKALEKFNREYAEKLGPEAVALLEKAMGVK
jgi:tripartite ATP-independent transporter DctP family solute receptor